MHPIYGLHMLLYVHACSDSERILFCGICRRCGCARTQFAQSSVSAVSFLEWHDGGHINWPNMLLRIESSMRCKKRLLSVDSIMCSILHTTHNFKATQ